MLRALSLAIALAASAGAAGSASAAPGAPTRAQITHADGVTGLVGWRRAPARHAPNRIVAPAPSGARVLTVETNQVDLAAAVAEALGRDGVTAVRLLSVRAVEGPATDPFRKAARLPGATFMAWIAEGFERGAPVRAAGFSVITRTGDDPGASVEMFVAPAAEFARRGGWVVPTVRYFGLTLREPAGDMSVHGRASPDVATRRMAYFFGAWMRVVIAGKTLATLGALQTLGVQQGTDQSQDTGLSDPLFKP